MAAKCALSTGERTLLRRIRKGWVRMPGDGTPVAKKLIRRQLAYAVRSVYNGSPGYGVGVYITPRGRKCVAR